MNLCCPDSTDVFHNLALEDLLLDRGEKVAPLLLLYVDAPCVVIGKNQVPWRECATGRLRARGRPMARRITGGGTVWHDPGNLNYAFIHPRDAYHQDEVFALLLRALGSLGIDARTGPHNGLFLGDRKFSGTAFCYRRQHVLHHGTLLVDTDLNELRACCTPALPQIATKAIASRPASVLNLREALPGLTTEAVADALIREAGASTLLRLDPALVAARAAELNTWDFLWGHTPGFDLEIAGCKLRVEHGRVAASTIPELAGLPFRRDALLERLPTVGGRAAPFFQSLESLDF